jgi:hypothetical protein
MISVLMHLYPAANKEELLDIIHHGAEKIVNSNEEYVVSST